MNAFLANMLADTISSEPIMEVIAFILVFGSFFLGVFFLYQLVFYSISLCRMMFSATQKSKSGKIAASPWVSIPIVLLIGGIVLYLLVSYGVFDIRGPVDSIVAWFTKVFTKQ